MLAHTRRFSRTTLTTLSEGSNRRRYGHHSHERHSRWQQQLRSSEHFFWKALIIVSGAAVASNTASCNVTASADAAATDTPMKIFRKDEIATHTTKSTGIYVYFKDGVYDITKFVANHPGGTDKIMLAAGGDIAGFWNLYQQHYNSELPQQLLASMRIGTLHPDDVKTAEAEKDSSDPYSADTQLSPVMKYLARKPINAQPPSKLLTDTYITPSSLWFVRNHHPSSHIDPASFEVSLQFDADSNEVAKLNLHEMKTLFKPKTVVSTLQCGGNRRAEMSAISKTNGSPWGVTAISTAEWRGVSLRDVLRFVGVTEESVEEGGKHYGYTDVQFVSADGMEASIPIHKALALRGDAILAYQMNGADIPAQHGAPLRAIIPGHVGVRNVKWVKTVRIAKEESQGAWQRGMSYKGFNPSVKNLNGIDVEKIASLQEQPVQSAITSPADGDELHIPVSDIQDALSAAKEGSGSDDTEAATVVVPIKGYAYSGGGRGIIRVDISADGGKTWQTAELGEGSSQPLDRAWGWTLWESDVRLPIETVQKLSAAAATASSTACSTSTGVIKVQLLCKATDASHNVQPDTVEGVWNIRGINNNAWHRINVQLSPVHEEEE